LLLIWNVNPVLIGLADLRGSAVARDMLESGADAREHGAVWATDDVYVDALLTATGVPSLSSRQLAGPERDAWAQLDPAPDVIQISGSPCVLADRMPDLTTIVASHELDLECLTEVDTFTWNGEAKRVYEVTARGQSTG